MSDFKTILPLQVLSPSELSGMPESTPILVAYSGGADSTALLHTLVADSKKTGATIYAAHVNHGIRGAEADRDEAFCRSVAKKLGIELFVQRTDVPTLAKEWGESIEMAARRVRYDFFDRLMEEKKIPLLATAHNADDNLETMLFNLVRGSGLCGISGIPVTRLCVNGTVIRPLLRTTRKEILAYCEAHTLSFVTDSTNRDTDYTRNQIRSEILPALAKINSSSVAHASQLSESLRADYLCLESMANLFVEEMRVGYGLELEKINGAPDAIVNRGLLALYREISDGESLEYTHIVSLRQLAKKAIPHSRVTLPRGIEGVIEGQLLSFQPSTSHDKIPLYSLPLREGSNIISQTDCEIVMGSSQNTKNIYKKSILLSLASDKIYGTLRVRSREAGDRILMGGMRKSLKKLFTEKKIPLPIRARLPIICDEEGILAVPMIGQRDGSAPTEALASNAVQLIFYMN